MNEILQDPQFKEALQEQAKLKLAREDFLAYCKYIDPSYQTPKHLRVLAHHLMAVERGDIKRLIITLPPRHGKSEMATNKFFGWCLGRDAQRTAIITSYGATLATRGSMALRDTILYNPRYRNVFPNIIIDPNRKSRDQWCLVGRDETVKAAGVGGGITGFGAWLLLIDDPIKDEEEAQSRLALEKIWQWYKNVSRTRLMPGGNIILIMTRWHELDLVGQVLNSPEADEFTVLHLPALSFGLPDDYGYGVVDEDTYYRSVRNIPKTCFPDPLGRSKDEPLWEEWWNKDFLLTNKQIMQHGFMAQYQGYPAAPEGKKFKRNWFKPITQEILDKLKTTVKARATSWDLAWSSKTSADFTVGLRATLYSVITDTNAYEDEHIKKWLSNKDVPTVMLVLEQVHRWQKEWEDSSEKIIEATIEGKPTYKLLVEAVASQNSGFKSLRKDDRMWRYQIIPIVPDSDKEVRAKAAIRFASLGCIYILYPNITSAPDWEEEFLTELGNFPNAAKDDQVDALTQLVDHWGTKITRLLSESISKFGLWVTPFDGPQAAKPIHTARPPELTVNTPLQRDRLAWV